MVEHLIYNQQVIGSNPIIALSFFAYFTYIIMRDSKSYYKEDMIMLTIIEMIGTSILSIVAISAYDELRDFTKLLEETKETV